MTLKKNLRVLISVFDKTGLTELVKQLSQIFILEIVSTGGTAKHLLEAGFRVKPVEEVSQFPEILSGRVKTLHPKIFGGILADKKDKQHLKELQKYKIKHFDLVVVNLYPFEKTIKTKGVSLKEAIEQIDIGGVTLLRAAGKNFQSVIPICEPKDYTRLAVLLNKGSLSFNQRRQYAQKVFNLTSKYDRLISSYLAV
jgi:phosphoribosylaminoimidazolecarboxamide formyltransferase/IMP cyclohydrolase